MSCHEQPLNISELSYNLCLVIKLLFFIDQFYNSLSCCDEVCIVHLVKKFIMYLRYLHNFLNEHN